MPDQHDETSKQIVKPPDPPPVLHPIITPQMSSASIPLSWVGTVLKLGGTGCVIACTAATATLGWLAYVYFDMRAKVNANEERILAMDDRVKSADDRIEAKVAARAEAIRQELSAEGKKNSEELQTIKDTIEFSQYFNETLCSGAPEQGLQAYTAFVNRLKPKDIADPLKPGIYKTLLASIVNARQYSFLGNDELAKIESVLRKELATCSANDLYNVAALYAMNGNTRQSRSILLSLIDRAVASGPILTRANGQPKVPNGVARYYTLIVLIDLFEQKSEEVDDRAKKTWDTLKSLEARFPVSTNDLLVELDQPAMSQYQSQFALHSGSKYGTSYRQIVGMLESRDFKLVASKPADGKTNVELSTIEFPKEKNTEKPRSPAPPSDC